MEAGTSVFRDLPNAILYSAGFKLCKSMVISETMMNIVPGDQSGWKDAVMSLPKI